MKNSSGLLRRLCSVALVLASSCGVLLACTDVLVTPGASDDGSAMIAYNADSGSLMGLLYHYSASNTTFEGSSMRKIYDWDSGKYLGEIPEAKELYNVVGNINEHGLCIGESTFGGVEVLSSQKNAIIDYGSLIYITLSRCKTALEAIQTMASLMDTYGYASEGESFSIADHAGDVWIMEVIGRGSDYGKLGAVWVARRVPDGYVTAHANQARITTFPRDDPDNCLFAEDVVDVAIHYGLYTAEQDPSDFSFSDVYDPVSYMGARASEARVWSIFSAIADDDKSFQQEYLDYASGQDVTHRMPLWIKPYKALALQDLMNVMNTHYEDTELDSSVDLGSGLYSAPYRPRPLQWEFKGRKYHNERSVGTQQTGWNFIAQMRPWMPPQLSALVWFGVDDSSTAPRVPVYGSSTSVSPAYGGKGCQDGVQQPLLSFDLTRAFWVQNMVSNFVYSRWDDAYPILRVKIDEVQANLSKEVAMIDNLALKLYNEEGPEAAVELVTEFGIKTGNNLHADWLHFYGELFVRYRDFFVIEPDETNPSCGCQVKEAGLSEKWKERIISETGTHYEIKETAQGSRVSESRLRALRA